MKTVVITGSARGLGLCMAKVFRMNNFNVVISDLREEALVAAEEELLRVNGNGKVSHFICDVTKSDDISSLIKNTVEEYLDNCSGIDSFVMYQGEAG